MGWDGHNGWLMPCVKTCRDACYYGAQHLRDDQASWTSSSSTRDAADAMRYSEGAGPADRLRRAREAAAAVSVESGHMAIVVLRELREELSEDFGPGDPVSRIEAIHAAPADPVDPRRRGRPDVLRQADRAHGTGELPASEPGAPWLPPNMRPWECSGCADALRSL